MSWFSDIAGRAEDLLNKVDKSAATALQKGKENRRGAPSDPPLKDEEGQYRMAPQSSPSRSGQSTLVQAQSRGASPTAPPTTLKSSKVKKREEEEELLAFLNSPEPLTTSVQRPSTTTTTPIPAEEHLVTITSTTATTVTQEKDLLAEVLVDNDVPLPAPPLIPLEEDEKGGEVPPCAEAESVDTRTGWSPEQEVEHLHMEAQQGRQLLQDLQRALQEEQGEKRRLQKKLEHWTSQVTESDGLLRDMQGRENDLKSLLSAKDSQLAVLRVRLQEADQRLEATQTSLSNANRSLDEEVNLNSIQQQSIDDLRSNMAKVESSLRQEQMDSAHAQREGQESLYQKEEELRRLTQDLTDSQKSLHQMRGQNRDLIQQLSQVRHSLEAAQQELSQYRLKAQRILHSKEKLIVALKERGGSNSEDSLEESFQIVDPPVMGEQEGEREALREELAQAQALGQALRQELAANEQAMTFETQAHEEQVQSLQEKLRTEEQRRREAQLEAQQNTEELRYLREDLSRTKNSLHSRIKDRETEIEKLRKQVTAKSLSQGGNGGHQQRELESRLKNLTESLIQKQTLVEALSTEKNALAMQMEVMERKLKEAKGSSSKSPTHLVGISTEGTRERLPLVFMESPYDSSVARKVKRAYSALDAFSIRLGSFLRRYPASRAFLFLYMALLHFWVMVVLCTYQPEIHPAIPEKNRTL